MLSASGNLFKCHEEVLYLQPLIPPTKRFDIFSPITGGCSEGLGALRFFFKLVALRWTYSKQQFIIVRLQQKAPKKHVDLDLSLNQEII